MKPPSRLRSGRRRTAGDDAARAQARRPAGPRRAGTRLRIGDEGVRGLRRQEGQLGGDAAGARRAAEEAAQFADGQAIHPSLRGRIIGTHQLHVSKVKP